MRIFTFNYCCKLALSSCLIIITFLILPIAAPSAAEFTPINCSNQVNLPWTFNVGGDSSNVAIYPYDEVNFPYNNRLSPVKMLIANEFVTKVKVRASSFYTEAGHDYFKLCDYYGAICDYYSGLKLPNTWFSKSTTTAQSYPIRWQFESDSSVGYGGIRFDYIAVECGGVGMEWCYTIPSYPGWNMTGVLLGENDVVYMKVPVRNSDRLNFLLSGQDGKNFDLYIKCGSFPSATSYNYSATTSDSNEFISLYSTIPLCDSYYWYIAVVSHSSYPNDKGVFEFDYSITKPEEYYSYLTAGNAVGSFTNEIKTRISGELLKALKLEFASNDGTNTIRKIYYYRNSSNCTSGCGGGKCDICFYNNHGGHCHVESKEIHYWVLDDPSNAPSYGVDYETINHEMGHCYVANHYPSYLEDEYQCNPWPTCCGYCGHTVMDHPWGWNNNYCIRSDHLNDPKPDCSFQITPPYFEGGWKYKYEEGTIAYEPYYTPDNKDTILNDYNGYFYIVNIY
jgi:hypothetical protein